MYSGNNLDAGVSVACINGHDKDTSQRVDKQLS